MFGCFLNSKRISIILFLQMFKLKLSISVSLKFLLVIALINIYAEHCRNNRIHISTSGTCRTHQTLLKVMNNLIYDATHVGLK